MKQFPYAQQIIWENDVEQIEWVDTWCEVVWESCSYVAKDEDGQLYLGHFQKYPDEDSGLKFCYFDRSVEVCDLQCWAKL